MTAFLAWIVRAIAGLFRRAQAALHGVDVSPVSPLPTDIPITDTTEEPTVPEPTIAPEISGISALATRQVPRLRDMKNRTDPVYGVVVHCTGSGIISKALAAGADPFEQVLAYYGDPATPYTAHYAVNYDGIIAQIADEHERAQHVGFSPAFRQAFLDGSWEGQLLRSYVDAWHRRWPTYKSPAHLFPGPSVNSVYCGVELLVWQPGCNGRPLGDGKYTEAQYRALAALATDVARRWGFPVGWMRTGRLACHEDLNPLERTSGGKGWDPGALRSDPWFSWPEFLDMVRVASSGIA